MTDEVAAVRPQDGFCDPMWRLRRTRRVADLPDISTYEEERVNDRFLVTLTCGDEIRARREPTGPTDVFRCLHCKATKGWRSYRGESGGRTFRNQGA